MLLLNSDQTVFVPQLCFHKYELSRTPNTPDRPSQLICVTMESNRLLFPQQQMFCTHKQDLFVSDDQSEFKHQEVNSEHLSDNSAGSRTGK